MVALGLLPSAPKCSEPESLPLRLPEERLGPVLGLLAEAGAALELHRQPDAERLQGRFEEGLAATEVADLDADVVEHGRQPTAAATESLDPDSLIRMEAAAAPRAQWTFAQWAVVILASLQLLWAFAGFFAEPSFDFGENAVTERVLGVDFNGVHALFETQPAYVFTFPNNTSDGIFHLITGTLFAAIAAIQIAIDRSTRPTHR